MPMLRRLIPAVAGLACCLLMGGCSITRKSASIDSISRTPFLGLELAPKRTAPAPETQRIKRDRSVPVDIEPAKLVSNGAQKDTSWWQRLAGSEKRPVISLPRTDVVEAPPTKIEALAHLCRSECREPSERVRLVDS